MKSILKWLLLLPVAAIIIVFAINNRHMVDVMLDPSSMLYPGKKIAAPLYLVILVSAMAGVLAGGMASWIKQGKHRKAARTAKSDARKLQGEAERLRSQLSALPDAEAGITAAYTGRNAA